MAGGQFPGGLDSFTANVDDVDDVLAADVNELQVGIVAIETELGTDPAGSCTDLKTRLAHSINDAGMLEFDDCTELTIAGDAITVTQNFHKIDTQGDAGTDDLDTINGESAGMFIFLRIVADARNVVIKHNTGNILCAGAVDITLDTTAQFAFGIYDDGQSKWLISHGAATGVTGSGANSYIAVYTGANGIEGTDDLQWDGTTLTIGDGTAGRDYILLFDGETKDGSVYWLEDEDYFRLSDDLMMYSTEKLYFRDTDISINSATDGHLDLDANVSIDANADISITDEKNIILSGTTGTKIGTATNQKLGFFNATPVVQQTELTDELTTITHTAPGTPDYAVQNLTDTSPFGFVTQDEGNTVLAVIANLQARVNELETKLVALGLLADAD